MSDKDEIFDYVMNTPDNTNPAILRGMLNDLNNGGDPGYDVETVTVDVIPEQTVTTEPDVVGRVAFLTLADGVEPPWPETLTVTFNGAEYELTGEEDGSSMRYIAPEDQFGVVLDTSVPGGGVVLCDVETVTISATTVEKTVTVTDDFKDAVAAANGSAVGNFMINITYDDDNDYYVMDKTWAEIAAAKGMPVAVSSEGIDGSVSKYFYPVIYVGSGELGYRVTVLDVEAGSTLDYSAQSSDRYPTYSGEQ